jgi:eukaryotic-like serine/threonine-protein kinase
MRLAVIVLAVVAAIAVGVAGYAIWRVDNAGAKVPDVVGLTAPAARSTLAGAGYAAIVDTTYSTGAPTGRVAQQDPSAAVEAAKGSHVTIFVNAGSQRPAVPELTGQTSAAAAAAVTAAGQNASLVPGTSSTVGAGLVYQQVPAAGTLVPRGSVITVYFNSTGPTVDVPPLVGLTAVQAATNLQQAGLTLGAVVTTAGQTSAAGTVIAQSIPAATVVQRGSAVDLILAGGHPSVVPDVLGLPVKQAEQRLEGLGFEARVTRTPGTGAQLGDVVAESPGVGMHAPRGSVVFITVDRVGR